MQKGEGVRITINMYKCVHDKWTAKMHVILSIALIKYITHYLSPSQVLL